MARAKLHRKKRERENFSAVEHIIVEKMSEAAVSTLNLWTEMMYIYIHIYTVSWNTGITLIIIWAQSLDFSTVYVYKDYSSGIWMALDWRKCLPLDHIVGIRRSFILTVSFQDFIAREMHKEKKTIRIALYFSTLKLQCKRVTRQAIVKSNTFMYSHWYTI